MSSTAISFLFYLYCRNSCFVNYICTSKQVPVTNNQQVPLRLRNACLTHLLWNEDVTA